MALKKKPRRLTLSGPVKGHVVRSPHCGQDGERSLICAVILQAQKEAERGDAEAAAWLASTGREWCEKLLDIEAPPGAPRSLAEAKRLLAADPATLAQRKEIELERSRERGARYRERLRTAQPGRQAATA